ncbi:hypothetical protein D0861_05104 [Hortaea werneckii]|uniref:Uncharacterized protein n=1 Tax=Hortaea werneckii TaxID=91943 RepID=A0A3M7FHD3_HORWE|nr:hypothetical protein D0861_05104 [Hortaea werneckii]
MRAGQRAQARRLALSLSAKSYASLSACPSSLCGVCYRSLKSGNRLGEVEKKDGRTDVQGFWRLASGPQCASSHLRGPRNRSLVGEVRTCIPLPFHLFRDRTSPVCASPPPAMRQH